MAVTIEAQRLASELLANCTIWTGSLAILVLVLSSYAVYQIWLHPLAQYPGPLLAKLTHLYSVYHAFKRDGPYNFYNLHRKHGPIIRWGPNHISVCSISAVEQIYGYKVNVRKSPLYASFYGLSILNAIDPKVHARKKRVMAQAFSSQAVHAMEPHVLSALRDWCKAIGDSLNNQAAPKATEWSSPKDMAHWCAWAVFDMLGEICFGKTFECSSKPDNHWFFEMLNLDTHIINISGQMPGLKKLGLEYFLRRGTEAEREKQIAFTRKHLGARLSLPQDATKRRDIIYFLQSARDPETGEGYSTKELISETTLLLGAGSDTSNTTLAATFYFLLHHPEILNRLTAEIRGTFDNVEAIVSGPTMQQMVYLRACIDESLRLCPPVPSLLPREVQPGGIVVDGHSFPAGTIIGVPTYVLHHSDKYFDEPFAYRPDRWLLEDSPAAKEGEGVTAEVLARQKKAFVPFSIGPRTCIGKAVALLEIEILIARTLWLYDMRLAPGMEGMGVGPKGEYKIKDNIVVGKEGPVLQFKKRA